MASKKSKKDLTRLFILFIAHSPHGTGAVERSGSLCRLDGACAGMDSSGAVSSGGVSRYGCQHAAPRPTLRSEPRVGCEWAPSAVRVQAWQSTVRTEYAVGDSRHVVSAQRHRKLSVSGTGAADAGWDAAETGRCRPWRWRSGAV